ncbi:hypothetical protein [Streptomyces sp. NPDC051572]|uniref:hypothetical protein n=1 Tax=unclassified Streptomyces TaxID=2593676 RepID=UPI00344D4993
MNTAVKIGIFGAALAATFGTAYGVGSGVDPIVGRSDTSQHDTEHQEGAMNESDTHSDDGTAPPGGLQVSQDGYTLDLKTPRIAAGKETLLRFVITEDAGKAVTDYQKAHDKDLHLILASRDLNTFHHVHPTLGSDGTWSIPVDLARAGDYRVFADFTPARKGASALTLGADLAVAGSYGPRALPAQKPTSDVDGYTVTLDGKLTPGTMSDLELTVSKDGEPVTDPQPYLGSYGHLVALRSGDLAYLHVHPTGEPGDGTTEPGPGISFMATAPSSGTYRLFLDFQHEGKVHTAAFTVTTNGSGGTGDSGSDEGDEHGQHS